MDDFDGLETTKGRGKSRKGSNGNLVGGMCFVGGNLIQTNEGNKPIECIQVGNKVYSQDLSGGGKKGYKNVINLYRNRVNVLIKIIIENVIIETTERHRFYTLNEGWIEAHKLIVEEKLVDAQGILYNIQSIERIALKDPLVVYNFEVSEWHTYFVSEKAILVHNDCDIGANK